MDTVLNTGDLSSGKSVLLKALEQDMKRDLRLSCINMGEIKPQLNKPLIETVCNTIEEDLELRS